MSFQTAKKWAALSLLLCGGLQAAPVSYQGHVFEAHVIQGNGMRYREFAENGGALLKVRPEEEYSVVINNPLPVRVGVALTIDGLNTIDGKRSSPRKARRWIIEPNASITIEGWQTGNDTARKFVFTSQASAYAQWRENREGKPFTKNLGVIGVAWFWNANELENALHPPQPFDDEHQGHFHNYKKSESRLSSQGSAAPEAARSEDRAGTGMGRQQNNYVTEVEFNPTAGMFAVSDVLKIYYEFSKESPVPLPFINEQEEKERFAPDMNS